MALPENFAGSNSQELHAYDALWVTHPTTTGVFEINANRAALRASPAAMGLYYYDQQPASADYDVSSTINTGSSINIGGVVGRCDATAATYYLARWNAGQLQLYKAVAGTLTLLGGVSQAMTNGVDYTIMLSMVGSAIKLYFDGVQKISVTDTAITAIGYSGIRSNSGSSTFYYDNFDVTNMGATNGTGTGAPSSLTLVAPAATATGTANGTGTGTPPSLTLVAPTATASGTGSSDGVGAGAPASLTLVAPTATATGTDSSTNGTGTGAPASFTLVAASATATGTSTGSGTFVTPVLKNNTGTVLAGETGITVNFYHPTTGALVLHKTGQTSNGSGIVTVSDPALVASTSYVYEVVLSGGARRLPLGVAA